MVKDIQSHRDETIMPRFCYILFRSEESDWMRWRGREELDKVISISIGLLVVSVVAGNIFIPSLYANLHSLRSKFVIPQQVCIVSHFILTLLNETLFMPKTSLGRALFSMSDYGENTTPLLEKFHIFVSRKLMQMISHSAYYNFYFMSLMKSFYLYMMIYNLLDYEIFRKTKNVMKLITISVVICLAATSDHLILILIRMKYPFNKLNEIRLNHGAQQDMFFCCCCIECCKICGHDILLYCGHNKNGNSNKKGAAANSRVFE